MWEWDWEVMLMDHAFMPSCQDFVGEKVLQACTQHIYNNPRVQVSTTPPLYIVCVQLYMLGTVHLLNLRVQATD
jgi:hypothetical protein